MRRESPILSFVASGCYIPKSTERIVNNFLSWGVNGWHTGCDRVVPHMTINKQTIEKWWNGLLPVEKYLAYWQVRALKHADDVKALHIAREVKDMNRTIVRYCKKVDRKKRKLQEAARSRAVCPVKAGWN